MIRSCLKTPIVLFAYNRTAPLRRVLERVIAARPATLILIADGPRADRLGDVDKCGAVRRLLADVDREIEGQVVCHYADQHLGCGRRIASGLDWVFSQHEEAIILEDDVLPEPTLFPYCEELLARFRRDDRIAMIGGCNFQAGHLRGPYSYFFSHCVSTPGWATWRRSWQHFDFEMKLWRDLRSSSMLEEIWQRPEPVAYWRAVFDQVAGGRDDVWDYQWAFSMWSRRALEVYPNCNLVSHIGCGEDSTHAFEPNGPLCNQPTQSMSFPLRHPIEFERNLKADLFEFHNVFSPLPPELFEATASTNPAGAPRA